MQDYIAIACALFLAFVALDEVKFFDRGEPYVADARN